jgi:CheY-like chemotaxis protein/HPt (histidine-containing phosphotransfer) domain-containing protein
MAGAAGNEEALRASLQGLIGALDLLAEAGNEEERRAWLAVARACAEELAAVIDDGAPLASGEAGLSILVADDVETNRLVLGSVLTRAGHRVEFAPDGKAAVAIASRGGFDVILMDMLMPELDGLEAAKAIRALTGATGQVAIIGLSASASPEDRARSLAAGLDEHLGKPIDRAALFASLRRLTARSEGVLDPSALAQLRIDVGPVQFDALLAEYRNEIERRLDAVAAPNALGDLRSLGRDAHDLKSSAAAVGAGALSVAAAALELGAGEGNADLAQRRQAVLACREATLTALDAVLAAPHRPPD